MHHKRVRKVAERGEESRYLPFGDDFPPPGEGGEDGEKPVPEFGRNVNHHGSADVATKHGLGGGQGKHNIILRHIWLGLTAHSSSCSKSGRQREGLKHCCTTASIHRLRSMQATMCLGTGFRSMQVTMCVWEPGSEACKLQCVSGN